MVAPSGGKISLPFYFGWGGKTNRGNIVSKTAFIAMMNGFEQRGLTEDLEFCDGRTDHQLKDCHSDIHVKAAPPPPYLVSSSCRASLSNQHVGGALIRSYLWSSETPERQRTHRRQRADPPSNHTCARCITMR